MLSYVWTVLGAVCATAVIVLVAVISALAIRFVFVVLREDALVKQHQKEWDLIKEDLKRNNASEAEILRRFLEYMDSLEPDPILGYRCYPHE